MAYPVLGRAQLYILLFDGETRAGRFLFVCAVLYRVVFAETAAVSALFPEDGLVELLFMASLCGRIEAVLRDKVWRQGIYLVGKLEL